MCRIIPFSPSMQDDILSFLAACLPESGRVFEPAGRHRAYQDIGNHFEAFFCLMDKDAMIGTCAIRRINEEACELKALFLLQSYHGRGLGSQMLEHAVAYAKSHGYRELYLDTLKTSERAIRLYLRHGFVPTENYNGSVFADVFLKLSLS